MVRIFKDFTDRVLLALKIGLLINVLGPYHPLSHFIVTSVSIQQFMLVPIFPEVILEHISPQFPGIRPAIASCQFKVSPKFILKMKDFLAEFIFQKIVLFLHMAMTSLLQS